MYCISSRALHFVVPRATSYHLFIRPLYVYRVSRRPFAVFALAASRLSYPVYLCYSTPAHTSRLGIFRRSQCQTGSTSRSSICWVASASSCSPPSYFSPAPSETPSPCSPPPACYWPDSWQSPPSSASAAIARNRHAPNLGAAPARASHRLASSRPSSRLAPLSRPWYTSNKNTSSSSLLRHAA